MLAAPTPAMIDASRLLGTPVPLELQQDSVIGWWLHCEPEPRDRSEGPKRC